MKTKQYLGDSVYADYDGEYLILTTENGFGASNQIMLEPSVYSALLRYVAWLQSQRPQSQNTDQTTTGETKP